MRSVSKSIRIEAPIDFVFAVSNRLESWPAMMDDCSAVEILSREGNKVTFRLKHVNGTSWSSWRVIHPGARFALAERAEPRAPFRFMHHLWTYKPLDDGATEMTWCMQFELPEPQQEREGECCEYLLKHSSGNQQRMKAYIEAAHAGAALSTSTTESAP